MTKWGDLQNISWGALVQSQSKGQTVADLKDKIFRATGGRFTDMAYMLQLLNDAQTDLADEAKMQSVTIISTVIDQDSYTLPVDFKSPRTLQDEESIPDFNQEYPLLDITENGFGYSVFNGNLIIKPTPQKVLNLNLYYYLYPPDLVNDTDVPIIDPHYHNLLATYAIMMILLSNGVDGRLVDRYEAQWTDGKRQFIVEMERNRKKTKVREKIVW
jgi:hypothetical protein